MLDRELCNWRIFGTFIDPDRLHIIEQWIEGNRLVCLSPQEQELIEKSREQRTCNEQEQVQIIQSAKMTSMDQLVMGIEHELNTPIAIIKSDSQQLHKVVGSSKSS